MGRVWTSSVIISPTVAPSPPYAGPGDIVSGAAGWWGLRAYTAASIGANAVRLREDGGNTEQDFVTIAGGGLDISAITTFKGGNNLFVVKLYDQTGNGFHFVQATAGSQPPFTLSAIGSLPAIDTTGGVVKNLTLATSPTVSQPFTISITTETTATTDQLLFFGDIQVRPGYPGSSSGNILLYAGSLFTPTFSVNNWHAFQAIFNGSSSSTYTDGATQSGDVGTGGISTNASNMFNDGGTGLKFVGYLGEFGIWSGGFNGTQLSNMNSNQHAYWGF